MLDRIRAALIGVGNLFDLDGRTTRARLQGVTNLHGDGLAADAEALRADGRSVEADMLKIINVHNETHHPGQGCAENEHGQCRARLGDDR